MIWIALIERHLDGAWFKLIYSHHILTILLWPLYVFVLLFPNVFEYAQQQLLQEKIIWTLHWCFWFVSSRYGDSGLFLYAEGMGVKTNLGWSYVDIDNIQISETLNILSCTPQSNDSRRILIRQLTILKAYSSLTFSQFSACKKKVWVHPRLSWIPENLKLLHISTKISSIYKLGRWKANIQLFSCREGTQTLPVCCILFSIVLPCELVLFLA